MKCILIVLAVLILSCEAGKERNKEDINLSIPEIYIIDAQFPLSLGDIDLTDRKNVKETDQKIADEIKKNILSYYFNECSGDSSETYFPISNVYLGTLQLTDKQNSIFVILLHHISGGVVNAKILFYNVSAKMFIDKPIDFNIHALYDLKEEKLQPSNLKQSFKLEDPEIDRVEIDNSDTTKFLFTRLFHNGTYNALQKTKISVSGNGLDTLLYEEIPFNEITD